MVYFLILKKKNDKKIIIFIKYTRAQERERDAHWNFILTVGLEYSANEFRKQNCQRVPNPAA